MSRKLSLAAAALSAMLLAVPAVAQQPAAKDSSAKTTTMAKPHGKHHKKGAKSEMAKPAAKDSTKK